MRSATPAIKDKQNVNISNRSKFLMRISPVSEELHILVLATRPSCYSVARYQFFIKAGLNAFAKFLYTWN